MTDSEQKNDDIEIKSLRLTEDMTTAMEFMTTFVDQPDHVAVILATSKMDEQLKHIIRLRLIPCSTGKDELLDSGQGLGTFSNRIDLSFRLGLIDSSLAGSLHILRKIRNDFAHAYEGQALDKPPHKNRVEELENRGRSEPSFEASRDVISKARIELNNEKISFVTAAAFVLARLESTKSLVTKVDSNVSLFATFP